MKKILLLASICLTLSSAAFADFNFLNKDGMNILLRNAGSLNFIMTYSENPEEDTYNVADLLSDWMLTSEYKTAVVKNECNVLDPELENILNCSLLIETVEEYEDGEEFEGMLHISYKVDLETKTVDDSSYSLYIFD